MNPESYNKIKAALPSHIDEEYERDLIVILNNIRWDISVLSKVSCSPQSKRWEKIREILEENDLAVWRGLHGGWQLTDAFEAKVV